MLVLSRQAPQRIVVSKGDQQITIAVLAISGNRVRLGIEAPRDAHVLREEIGGVTPAVRALRETIHAAAR